MGAGVVMVLAGSCGDFLVGICVPKVFKKYSNGRVSRSMADRVSRSSFSLLMKHASKSMIRAMLSGLTGMSTRLEEEAKCAEAACCCMHSMAYYFHATIVRSLGVRLIYCKGMTLRSSRRLDEAFEDMRSL